MPKMFPTQWVTLALFFPSMILIQTVKMSYFFSQPTPSPHSSVTNTFYTWA